MDSAEFQGVLQHVFSESKALHSAIVERIEEFPRHASLRRFFRVFFRRNRHGASAERMVAVLHGESKAPKLSSSREVTQEEAFVELAAFFRDYGVPVPAVLAHDSARHVVLMEDVGDLALWQCGAGVGGELFEQIQELLGASPLVPLCKKAIDVIKMLQTIPHDPRALAFQRALSFEQYRRELDEFTTFLASPRGIRPSARKVLEDGFDALAETVSSFPRRLSHFDFISWNLQVTSAAAIRVLDFQDACLASPVRDFVALINCRGMDEMLGERGQRDLIEYYTESLSPGPSFEHWYAMTLLHWDFRVSGRFMKLKLERALDLYAQWVPGTLRRLGRTIPRYYRTLHGFDDVAEIVLALSPEAREGSRDTWNLFS